MCNKEDGTRCRKKAVAQVVAEFSGFVEVEGQSAWGGSVRRPSRKVRLSRVISLTIVHTLHQNKETL